MKKILKFASLGVIMTMMISGCSNGGDIQNESDTEEAKANSENAEVYSNPKVESSEEALELLKEGNNRFVNDSRANYDLGDKKLEELESGQSPFAVVVTCADSRVVPEHLFDQGLGDIFTIRVAGNVLDHNEIASVEYAVDHLDTPLIVMLGHESCGAVGAAVEAHGQEEAHSTEHLDYLIGKIIPAVEEAKELGLSDKELSEKAIELNVENGIEQLKEESNLINEKIESGALKIVGGKYMLSDGSIGW